jgi:glyoxylase-like metal-dependent hydrolase (beta-lactamase superfamily II)/rhodanese-related sulfurtransferase
MYFQQFLRTDLGCASYLIGSATTGEAAVVDPQWDITPYLRAAAEAGLRITCCIETHNHADHVSGHGKLAAQTGAAIYVYSEAGVAYAHEPLADDGVIRLGEVEIRALHTPGHRPEHISLVVTDTAAGTEPRLVLTGDALFVGAVGRPDLAVEPGEGAHDLFHSLHDRLLRLPDSVELYPGHVAGSLCGKAMRPEPMSTIGDERRSNPALQMADERAFVVETTRDLPPQPPHLQQIVARNRGPLLTADPPVPRLSADDVLRHLRAGAQVLDTRSPAAFGAGHIPTAINVALQGGSFPTRAAWVLDDRRPYLLVVQSSEEQQEAVNGLLAVGLDRMAGVLEGGMTAWTAAGRPVDTVEQVTVQALHAALRGPEPPLVLDVRDADEWAAGHVAGALHIPFQQLPARLSEVPRGRMVAAICAGGFRSSVALSLLQRAGYARMQNVRGGTDAWADAGLPLTRNGAHDG